MILRRRADGAEGAAGCNVGHTGEMAAKPVHVQIRTPKEMAAGVYANGVNIWSTRQEFTVDFFCSLPPETATADDGDEVVVSPQEVVARIKIPPPLVFEVMKNLNQALARYEAEHGKPQDFTGGVPTEEDGEMT